jgi:hypothetical protein
MKLTLLMGALLPLTLAACSGEQAMPTEPTQAPANLGAISRSVHAVECGCAIESIGKCGNYVILEGQPIKIGVNEQTKDLGGMEWCGQSGAHAEVEGEVADGEFVANYFKKVEA